MADIIQLLPESIANQIAAGEVVQRPASVVKELLENAIDAGCTSIKLIVKDAGKTLVQVIDNGCGMSETDARMCFERHATSKIREAKDLFSIRTMGFRGEALASIAAIAQVEMRTRLHNNELGTRLVIEGSQVLTQEPCQCTAGTNIQVKNLFYNVPARRNFLKSNAIEMRHLLDEFQRVALANVDVFFSLHHNDTEIFHLPPGQLRQRIVGTFGKASNPKLVQVREETDAMTVEGYIGKPEFARKNRGEQLFFVNQRFIKSGYLHHAVMSAYEDLIQKDSYPMYVLFIEMDPARIDINVHPTKQEIKFDDERLVYNYLKVAVRHALGRYSLMPTLDFEQETSFSPTKNFGLPFEVPGQETFEKELSGSGQSESLENTNTHGFGGGGQGTPQRDWRKLFEGLDELEEEMSNNDADTEGTITIQSNISNTNEMGAGSASFTKIQKEPYQVHGTYIISHIKSGFLLIDQQAAHERILFEKFLEVLDNRQAFTQKDLFPKTIILPPADAVLMQEILPHINLLGFDIQPFGNDAFVIQGIPAELVGSQDEVKLIETLLYQYKRNVELNLNITENLARSLARSAAIKRGQPLEVREMRELIDQLFACAMPFKSPSGRNCFITYEMEMLEKSFKAG